MKKRLLVDMDGVLADVYQQFISFEERDLGIRKSISEVNGKSETEAFINAHHYVRTEGFFRNAPLISGSAEALNLLNAHYELFIVSAAVEFPLSLKEKIEWLSEHFPFISWHQIVFCGLKTIVSGDIMIDDQFKNLDHFKGQTILFTQPHNTGFDDKHHQRVASWSEILEILL